MNSAAGKTQVLREGDLVCLAGGEMHALKAIDDSSVLITMLLHGAWWVHLLERQPN